MYEYGNAGRFGPRARRGIFLGCASAALVLLVSPGRAGAEDLAASRVIHVSATANVSASPDRARISVAVITRAATAKEAAARNAVDTDAVLARLRKVGSAAQLSTAGYDISAQYEYSNERGASKRKLVGYQASNRVEVKTSELDEVGALVDAAVAAGANEVSSIEFFLEDEEQARRQATLEAGHRARSQAETVAESLGVALGDLVEASTSGAAMPSPRPLVKRMAMAEYAPGDVATPMAPGTVEVTATVDATFAIR